MPENKPGGLKLKLRKADTNRLKTETGRIKTMADGSAEAQTQAVPPPVAPVPVPAPAPVPAPRPDQTAEIRDPMALRETSQGKLRRIQSPDETANAVAPASSPVAETAGEAGIKRETVRLKVVRDKKKTGPQILPATDAEPEPAITPPPPAPMPPSPEVAAPSAQTVKISLPGLKKASVAPGAPSLKRATSTVRVQEPPTDEAGSTVRVAPPATPAEFQETSTATLKIGVRPPPAPGPAEPEGAAPAGPAGTIKINPGPALTARPADADQNKQITATLKIRPGTTEPPAPEPVEPSGSNKQVTATLKIRSGAPETPDAASTVRITPPAAAGAETVASQASPEEAEGPRPSLRLKRTSQPAEDSEAASTVRLPGIGEAPETDDASKTVALPMPEGTEEEAPAEAAEGAEAPVPKKGLKLKTCKKHAGAPTEQAEGEEAAEEASAEEGEATPAFAPRPAEGGPGIVAAIGSIAACGALAALLYQLVMDYLAYIR